MSKFKKYVDTLIYSFDKCKKFKVIFLAELTVMAVVSIGMPLIQNYFAKYIVSSITLKAEITEFIKSLIVWIAVILAMKIAVNTANYYYSKKNRKLVSGIMQEINHIRMSVRYELTLDSDYQKKLSVARAVTDRSIPCIAGIQNSAVVLLANTVNVFIYTSIIAKLHWIILAAFLCVYVIELLINLKHVKFSRKYRDKLIPLQRKTAYVAGRSGDVRAAKDVRIYDMSKWFSKKYDDLSQEKIEIIDQREKSNHNNRILNGVLIFIRSAVSYIFLLLMFCNGKIDISDFVFFIGVMATFSSVLLKLQGNVQEFYNNFLETNDYIDFENSSRYTDTLKQKLDLPEEIKTIEFADVSYRYPGSKYEILNKINLTFRKNEKTGIVGLNGAGKTTLVLLMCGLLQPTEGKILINGIDLSDYNINEYINLFSAVFQDISVLPDNVLNNIGLQKEYSEKELDCIRNIVAECGLENIDLNDKFINEIFDNAICLSGGEMQKLALARAIYKTSQVLILDEPTASLDPLAEQQLYLNYGKFSGDKISIFISHRLASTSFCDNIVMLEQGRIAEKGNHNQLMNLNGKYKELFETQREYYKKKSMEVNCL